MGVEIELDYTVGIDLGQAHDPTAIAIVEAARSRTVDKAAATSRDDTVFRVRHLERLKLGMTYPAQVAYVQSLLRRAPLQEAMVFFDSTGVGRPVGDLFRQARIRNLKEVTITGGREVTARAGGYNVAKIELVSRLQAHLHSGTLLIEPALPDAATLARELQDFRVTFTDAGNATFNAREGAHDDLVLATGLAVFGAMKGRPIVSANLRYAN